MLRSVEKRERGQTEHPSALVLSHYQIKQGDSSFRQVKMRQWSDPLKFKGKQTPIIVSIKKAQSIVIGPNDVYFDCAPWRCFLEIPLFTIVPNQT